MEITEKLLSNEGLRGHVTERLKKRDDERQAKNEKLRAIKADNLAENEQIKDFEAEFQRLKMDLMLRLDRCTDMTFDDNKTALRAHLDKITEDLHLLQKFVADSQIFLSTYDKRVANETLSALQDRLNQMLDTLLPKKKFAFRSRRKDNERKPKKSGGDEPDKIGEGPVIMPVGADLGFADRNAEDLVKFAEEVRGKDVVLARLKNCKVEIYGNPGTVHVSDCADCTILLGPVSTSVFVSGCVRVSFSLACQQLRVHTTTDSTFYVHVSSRSIIEDSESLLFSRYNWQYEGLKEHFQEAGLDVTVNNWKAIDDFNWLAADKASPNWSFLLPDNQS